MILLIRHAEAEGGEGRYIGSTDLPLSSLGQAQALALAEALARSPAPASDFVPDHAPDLSPLAGNNPALAVSDPDWTPGSTKEAPLLAAIYVSPLQRALRTAAPLAERSGLVPVVLDDLREIHLGQWEGLLVAELRRTRPEEYAARGRDFAGFRPPGGENFLDVARRADMALQRMASGPQPCAAITHAGVIRVLLCRALGLSLDQLFQFRPGHTNCTLMQLPTLRSNSSDQFLPVLIAKDIPASAAALLLRRPA
ncbi:MAG: histidine phosphatase family protein [Desulfovibrio sp.]